MLQFRMAVFYILRRSTSRRKPKKQRYSLNNFSLAKLKKTVADNHTLWLHFSCPDINHWFPQRISQGKSIFDISGRQEWLNG